MRTDKYSDKIFEKTEQEHGATPRCQESTLVNETVKTIHLIALKSIIDGRCTFMDVCLEQRERFTATLQSIVCGLSWQSSLLPVYIIDSDITSNLRAAAEA